VWDLRFSRVWRFQSWSFALYNRLRHCTASQHRQRHMFTEINNYYHFFIFMFKMPRGIWTTIPYVYFSLLSIVCVCVCVCVIYSSVIQRCFLIFAGFIVMNVNVMAGGEIMIWKGCWTKLQYTIPVYTYEDWQIPLNRVTIADFCAVNRTHYHPNTLHSTVTFGERESELPADGPDCFITLGISSRSLLVSLDENK
jgi:hypothetical protein